MKKSLTKILALVLCLALLCGCELPGSLPGDLSGTVGDLLSQVRGSVAEHNPHGLKFGDILYARPDMDKLAADIDAVKKALDGGESLKTVEDLLDVCMDDYDVFSTMNALANIYNCKDLRDEYYAAEYEWISEESSKVSQLFDEMYYACAGSSLGPELEDDYFWEGFCEEYADPEDSYYNDETVALMQRESELVSRYRELLADPVISFEGEEVSFYEKLEELKDFSTYRDYYRYLDALMTYYRSYNEPLAEIYIELMRVRSEMAEKMGFSSCEEMEYVFFFERDYTPQDAAVFIDEVRSRLVPIYVWANRNGVSYSAGNESMSQEELYAGAQKVTDAIGRECAEAFSFMSKYGFYDIEPGIHKADTSFQTYLSSCEAPFIFLNPTGTDQDLVTFLHEFGHYTDAYVNFNANESIDLAEVFSQAMEFLSLSYMDGVLSDEEIAQLRDAKMSEALETFIQQCAFSDFESKAHALGPDTLSAEKLNELALQTARDFGFYEEDFAEFTQYYWMDIIHLFEYPFYVISYPVSLDVAMQIYALEREQEGKGMDKFFEILPRDYYGLLDTVANGGLLSPFTEGSMASVAAVIGDTLGYKGQAAQAA